jgi:membrane protease subunit HflC
MIRRGHRGTVRSEGEGRSQEILGNMGRELRRIESEAARTAEGDRGRWTPKPPRSGGPGQDPAFYAFWRTLESYSASANTTLMIDAKSDFFILQSTSTR